MNVADFRKTAETALWLQNKEQLIAVRNQIKTSLEEMERLAQKGRWGYSVILPMSILAFENDFLDCFEQGGFRVESAVLGKKTWFFTTKERHEISIFWDNAETGKNPLEIFYGRYQGVVTDE